MTNANDLVKLFSSLFSSVGVPFLWTVFLGGVFLRWLANSRVKAQLEFLTAFDRSLQDSKTTQSISSLQIREKLEALYRTYFAKNRLAFLDKLLGVDKSSWQLVDRLVSSSFDKKAVSVTERSRHLLSSIPSLTQFFKMFSLGAFHRLGAATPALLILLGALGTYAGFLHALPTLSGVDIGDLAATNKAVQYALHKLYTDTGYTILGTVLAIVSVLINAAWDAERTFQGAVNRLAHIVEFLGNLDKAGNASETVHRRVKEERAVEAAAPVREPAVAEAPEVEKTVAENIPVTEASVTEKPPRDRLRQRAQVVQAEQDWGPLPPSAVPSPRKRPIRVEAAEAPKLEEEKSTVKAADEAVAEMLRPEMTEQSQVENTPHVARRPEAVTAPVETEAVESRHTPTPIAIPVPEDNVPLGSSFGETTMPETALPADWEAQIRSLINQVPTQTAAAVPQEIQTPYDEILERTLTGIHAPVSSPTLAPAAETAAPSDSPTEAELLAMMVPKEWASQRPADLMPAGMTDHEYEHNLTPQAAPQVLHEARKPQPSAPVPSLSSAEQDRLAILNHRLEKVSLYLRKAKEDLAESIISQEMYDDECARWNVELATLGKEIASLSAKLAA